MIPGTAEGVFGWITINYLLQILQNTDPEPLGALDIQIITLFYKLYFNFKKIWEEQVPKLHFCQKVPQQNIYFQVFLEIINMIYTRTLIS